MSGVSIVKPGAIPKGAAEQLMFLAVVFVPFQQAITVNVGFPLKISEITGLLAVAMFLVEGRRPVAKLAGGRKLIMFALVFALSTSVWLGAGPPAATSPGYERGFNADLLQYFGYGVMVLVLGWYAATRLGPTWIAKGIAVGVKLAATYCALQLALSFVGLAPLLEIINGATQNGTAYGFSIPRNGPFLEGNYLGFFAGIALFIAARLGDNRAIMAALFCLLYSQSTTGLLGVVIAVILLAVTRPSGLLARLIATAALGLAFAVTFIPAAGIYVARQVGKLGFGDTEELGQSIEYSLRSRTLNIETGISMTQGNPLLGVGAGRYGYWDSAYTDYEGLSSGFNAASTRGIANNAYVQIFAETGVIAGILFVLVLLGFLWRLRGSYRSDFALATFLIVGLNATPAWTVLPIWLVIAYLGSVEVVDLRVIEKAAFRDKIMAKRRPVVVPAWRR
jgi:O-antigen ligase